MRFYERSVVVAAPRAEVFNYATSRAGFIEQFPYPVRWIEGPENWQRDDVLEFSYRVGGIWLRHRVRIVEFEPGSAFTDVMESGFYRVFRHRHIFDDAPGGTRMTDQVEFELRFPDVIDRTIGVTTLNRTFGKRHEAVQKHFLEVHHGT